jgi:hypothetical protein
LDNYSRLKVCDDILLFFDDEMIYKLKISPIWAVDGTFEMVP